MIQACPLCGSERIEVFLERSGVPVYQNMIARNVTHAMSVPRGDLSMTVCIACGFVFNRAFDPALITYDASYDNDQAHSPRFDAYMDELVGRIGAAGVSAGHIVEVGCGKGQFLRKLVGAGYRGTGYDTSYEGSGEEAGGRLRFVREYIDARAAAINPDAVVCRHVIEHVTAPILLLRSMREAAHRAKLFLETPCIEWIFANSVIWDFFYEHCSLFSAESLAFACRRAGFDVETVDHTFGGQYLWLTGTAARAVAAPSAAGAKMQAVARDYARKSADLEFAWSSRLRQLHERGPIVLWGAGAKGVTFANLLDPLRRLITCVVDINPKKQGGFVPGAGHRVVAPADLAELGVRAVVLLNPNYRAEVAAQVRGFGNVEIVEAA